MSEEPSDFRYSQKALDEDAYAEADPITDYPSGSSIMPVSDTADWHGNDEAGTVVTEWSTNGGVQHITYASGWTEWRWWDPEETDWTPWRSLATTIQLTNAILSIESLPALVEGRFAEPDPITDYPPGISIMPVSAGANWGPNTGQAGLVEAVNAGSEGTQTFTQYSNGNKFSRGYASSTWSAWVALQ